MREYGLLEVLYWRAMGHHVNGFNRTVLESWNLYQGILLRGGIWMKQ